jgi:flagellar biosynthesis/type III secretory pathway protein FliH
MFRSALLIATLLTIATITSAQEAFDPHYAATRTSAIARKSVFVHGYLHGYEEGFHLADLDIHMGRAARDIRKCKEGREAAGYRREFGNKRVFESGYREGVRVGYADGVAGRSFRAVNELEALESAAPNAAEVRPDAIFDQGFSAGYTSGQHQGLEDGRSNMTFTPPLAACPPLPTTAPDQPTFCAAYAGGYRVGYADGFTNVARRGTAQAEARGGR